MSTFFCFSLLLLGSLSLFQCVSSQSIAPDDADATCLNIPIRNTTFPNEKILLDSQNYRSTYLVGAEGQNNTWLTIDYDGGGSGRLEGAGFVDAVRLFYCYYHYCYIIYLRSGMKLIKEYSACIKSMFVLLRSLDHHLQSRGIG